MRKMLILGLCFLLLAIPIHAETTYIDAQPYTTCDDGQCQTVVPLDQFMNQGLITALKSIDLTPAKPVLTEKLLEFDYAFDGNNMIFSGQVVEDVYWTFNLGNSFIIDPWWNVTTYDWTTHTYNTTATTCGGATGAGGAYLFGHKIEVGSADVIIKSFTIHPDTVATKCFVYDSGLSIIYSSTIVDDVCTLSNESVNASLSAGGWYYLISNSTTRVACTGGFTFPINADNFTVNNSVYGNPLFTNVYNEYFDIMSIEYQTYEASGGSQTWYENHLYLNGNETNITLANSTALVVNGTTNLTGATVLLYINGTLSGNDTDTAQNETNITAGLYNITGWFGNASTNETITLWANMTFAVSGGETYSYTICSANDTLFEHRAGYSNGSFSYNDTYTLCPTNCSNITYSCNPPLYQQNLLLLGGFIIICIIGYVLWRRL